ncbi:BolA family protein [Fluviispira multicolorata]|uniref:BolA/IbaG family iron-sulfur metabolism protein n=1 Tax=Fluviispira multicolorata TaxID=2654512 RepID=A0A833JF59_9BACT|nr:BolA/IbaG family iron-sulfur metabolism protein [Fluviispira multicolorata]KAB8033243.1 BolA/IbaG family iron-sulfur metabolism protein [Fluviispira multicolorata]
MLSHEVKERIENGIDGAECFVNEFSGGTDHYSVIVISNVFEGQASLKRHRMIMDLFKDEVNSGEVHALSIKALTQKQWTDEKQKSLSSQL